MAAAANPQPAVPFGLPASPTEQLLVAILEELRALRKDRAVRVVDVTTHDDTPRKKR